MTESLSRHQVFKARNCGPFHLCREVLWTAYRGSRFLNSDKLLIRNGAMTAIYRPIRGGNPICYWVLYSVALAYKAHKMTGEEFQQRLDAAFTHEGSNYGRVHLIFQAEGTFSHAVLKFNGQIALSDAFKACFLEAVELLNTHCRLHIKTPLSEFYPQFLPRVANGFHTLCAAERAAYNGYPRPAFTTLRNVFDDCVLTSAALQRITDFYKIEGVDPSTMPKILDPIAIKKARKNNELEVRKKMVGSESGLSASITGELEKLDALFDLEVHGSRLSLTQAADFMQGKGALPVLPSFTEDGFALFMNRYNEVAWALHRLVPAMQPPDAPMPADWEKRWELVDESFEIIVRSLSKQLGKNVGNAYADFMKVKFPFTAKSTFPL